MSAATKPVGYRQPAVPWNGLTVTDLFCGAGGSSSGLVEAGYKNTYDGVTTGSQYLRAWPVDQTLPLQTGTAEHGLAVPAGTSCSECATYDPRGGARGSWHSPECSMWAPDPLIVNLASGADESRSRPISDVLPSIVAGGTHAADYLLLGTKRDKVKQAGNAVTPPAARDLGHAVAEFLLEVAA